ncbi:MAG: hypothetical protein ACO4CG_14155 [Prochlorothrix sp.]
MVNLHALTASPRSDSPLSDPHIDPESDPLHVTPSVPGAASTTAIATTPTITAVPPPRSIPIATISPVSIAKAASTSKSTTIVQPNPHSSQPSGNTNPTVLSPCPNWQPYSST